MTFTFSTTIKAIHGVLAHPANLVTSPTGEKFDGYRIMRKIGYSKNGP